MLSAIAVLILNTLSVDLSGSRSFEAHSAVISAIAVSSDGKVVATGARDGSVRLWTAGTDTLLWESTTAKAPVSCLAFSLDSKVLAAGDYSFGIRILSTVDGTVKGSWMHIDAIAALAFGADGSKVAAAGIQGSGGVFDVRTGKKLTTLSARQIALIPSSHEWLVLNSSHQLMVYDERNFKVLRVLPTPSSGPLLAVNRSATRYATYGSHEAKMSACEFATGICESLNLSGTSAALLNGPETMVYSSAEGFIRWWNVKENKAIHTWQAPGMVFLAVAANEKTLFGAQGKRLMYWSLVP